MTGWHATILTLFPDMFPGPLDFSLAGKALKTHKWKCEAINIRNFATEKHRKVDDTPAGGGPGMVMRADVLAKAFDAVTKPEDLRPRLLMSPRGKPLTQDRVRSLSRGPGVILICGRFEGLDQRVIDARHLEEVSLGDYILSGGEIAAMALLDACVRLLPNVMGKIDSTQEESFSFENALLEYPHYTRPAVWEDHEIPPVLLSGNHEAIRRWRHKQALKLTRERRPDLMKKAK